MDTYDAALINLQVVSVDRANELLRCSWDGPKLLSRLVRGTVEYARSCGCPPGGNPGVTICTRAHVVIDDEVNVTWLAAWTWQPDVGDVTKHLQGYDWERVEAGVYGGRKREGATGGGVVTGLSDVAGVRSDGADAGGVGGTGRGYVVGGRSGAAGDV